IPAVFVVEGALICYMAEWFGQTRREYQRVGEEFRLLLDGTVNHALILLDPVGGVRSWNRGAERVTGFATPEAVGRHYSLFRYAKKDGGDEAEVVLGRAAVVGRAEAEEWWARKDGTRFWAAVAVTALRDARGSVSGYVLAVSDVTDRRAVEAALRESELRL